MAVRTDNVQLNIIIGDDKARKELAELNSQAAKLKTELKDVQKEHNKYIQAGKQLETLNQNLQKSGNDVKRLTTEYEALNSEYSLVKAQLNQVGGANAELIAREKELANAMQVKNYELKYAQTHYTHLIKRQNELIAVMNQTKKASEEWIAANKKLSEVEEKIKNIKSAFDITKLTLKELGQEADVLKIKYKNAIPGSEAYQQYENRLIQVNTRMKELQQNTRATAAAQMSLKDKISSGVDFFNKYAASAMAIVASLSGVVFSVRKAIDAYNEFEQAQANLSALTGLTGENLAYLSDAAKELSTSVSADGVRITNSAKEIVDAFGVVGSQRPELLKNKEALKEVTEQALILAAASDGDLQASTIAVTSALNNFDLQADQTGRVINALAAGSLEGAAGIDKTTQVFDKAGTTANLMGISIEGLVGITQAVAPKFNDMSQAGNSLDKVLLKMKDSGIGYKDGIFDINLALDQVREKTQKGEKITKLFGVEHAKMVEVLLAEQDELNRYTAAVTGTNVATEQAAIKTATNAAKLEQAKNRAEENAIVLGEQLAPALTFSTNAFSYLLKALVVIIENWDTFIKYLITATVAITTYTVATQIANAKTGLLSKGITMLKNAYTALNTAMNKNPWTLILTALVAAGTALYLFTNRTKETIVYLSSLEKQQQRNADRTKKFNEAVSEQQGLLDAAILTLKKGTKGTQEHTEALEFVNKEYGKYLPNLLSEKSSLQEIEQAQRLATEALIRNIAIKLKHEEISEASTKAVLAQRDALLKLKEQLNPEIYNNISTAVNTMARNFNSAESDINRVADNVFSVAEAMGATQSQARDAVAAFNDIVYANEQLNKTVKETDDLYNTLAGTINTTPDRKITSTGGDDLSAEEKKAAQKKNEDLLKLKEEYRKNAQAINEELLKDDIDRLSAQRNNELNALDQRLKDTEEYKLLENAIITKYDEQLAELRNTKAQEQAQAQYNYDLAMLEVRRTSGEDVDNQIFNLKMENLKLQHEQQLITELEFLAQKAQLEADWKAAEKEEFVKLYEEETFETQARELEALEMLHDLKLISEEEYLRRKEEANKLWEQKRLAEAEKFLTLTNQYLDIATTAFEISKNEEMQMLDASLKSKLAAYAGNEEEQTRIKEEYDIKKEEIEKKYKRRQQIIDATQAAIDGLVAIIKTAATLGQPAALPFQIAQGIQTAATVTAILSKQYAKGKYPVIGRDDGRHYEAIYTPRLGTGIVREPVLVAEEPEMVVDNKTLYNAATDRYGMTVMDHAKSIMSIKYNRTKQYASGKDLPASTSSSTAGTNIANQTTASDLLFQQLIIEVQNLRTEVANSNKMLKAYVVYEDITDAGDRLNEIKTDTQM